MRTIETIHESLLNGQRKQMADQIDEYGYGFWLAYIEYLWPLYKKQQIIEFYSDAVISYHEIRG